MPRNKKVHKPNNTKVKDGSSEVKPVTPKPIPRKLTEIVPDLFWHTSTVEYGYSRKGGVLLASLNKEGVWVIGNFLSIRKVVVDGEVYNVPHSILVPTTEEDSDGIGEGRKPTKVLRHHHQWLVFRRETEFKPRQNVPLGRRLYDGVTTSYPKYKPPPYEKNISKFSNKSCKSKGGGLLEDEYNADDDPDNVQYGNNCESRRDESFNQGGQDTGEYEFDEYDRRDDHVPRGKGGLRGNDEYFLNGNDRIIGIN